MQRKYLPNFKKSKTNQSNIIAETPVILLPELDRVFYENPINTDTIEVVYANITPINKEIKIEEKIKTLNQIRTRVFYQHPSFPLLETAPEEPQEEVESLTIFEKLVYIACICFLPFLSPLFIYMIEGSGTIRYKRSVQVLIIFLGFLTLAFFIFLTNLFFWFFFNAAMIPYFGEIVIGFSYFLLALLFYLGVKTVLKN